MSRRQRQAHALLRSCALVALASMLVGCSGEGRSSMERQAEVARRGRLVMPFDLDETTHVFTPRHDGGVQEVVADDVGDQRQVRLIREHLKNEAAAFRRGDFSDPAAVHGGEMPGLRELRSGADRISVRYRPIPAGARIRYQTHDEELVRALYHWFEAQVSDHGAHAEDGGHN